MMPIVGLAPSAWVLAIALFWIGAIDSVMDGAMNAHGLRVQRLYCGCFRARIPTATRPTSTPRPRPP